MLLLKGKKVVRLEYEAYVPMATREFEKLCEGVRERWRGRDVHAVTVHHRDGSQDAGFTQPFREKLAPLIVIMLLSDNRLW